MMDLRKKYGISSLAAPTDADRAKFRALSEEERAALIAEHIAEGSRDIAEGRFTELATDEDIQNFFEKKRAKYEAPVI